MTWEKFFQVRVTCFPRELGKQVTNIEKNFEHDTNLCNRMCVFYFFSHNLSGVGENVEEEIISKN